MLPVGHCQVPPPLRPLQAETTVVGSQQGLRCGSICPVTTGQESVVNRCVTNPHSVQISHPRRQGPSTQETILSDHSQQCTVLPRCCLSGSPWRLAWHQRSSGSMPFEYAVDGSTSQTHTGSNSILLIPQSHRTATSLRSAKLAWSPLIAAGSLWDLTGRRGSAADRSEVSKVAEVAAKFWTCSKQAQWGRRGNRSPYHRS